MSNFAQSVSMPCIIDLYQNEYRNHLLDLGYKEVPPSKIYKGFIPEYDKRNILYTDVQTMKFGLHVEYSESHKRNECRLKETNPQLFIAIAAMRTGDDVHVGEYMVCVNDTKDVTWGLCKKGDIRMKNDKTEFNQPLSNNWRKATLQELIEKFTEKEQPFVPKRGDVVYCAYSFPSECSWVSIVSTPPNNELPHRFDYECLLFIEKNSNGPKFQIKGRQSADLEEIRLATDQEKQLLFDALAKQGKRYNADKFCIEVIPVNPHQSMIDEWEASGRTKVVEFKYPNTPIWRNCSNDENDKLNFVQWIPKCEYRFKPEEKTIPARPVKVKAPANYENLIVKGEIYDVKSIEYYTEEFGYDFIIVVDGEEIYTHEKQSNQMGRADWIVLQREGEPEPIQESEMTASEQPNRPLELAYQILDECQGDFHKVKDVYQNVGSQLERLLAAEKKERGAKVRELKGLTITNK